MVTSIFLLFYSSICFQITNTPFSEQETNKLIELIKARLHIVSMECSYITSFDINPNLCGGGEYPPIENQFQGWYQDGNFLVSKTHVKKIKRRNTESEPKNLLEVLAKRYMKSEITFQNTNNDTKEIISHTNLYFYKGKGAFRRIYYEGEENVPITYLIRDDMETKHEYAKYGDIRWVMGYIGFNLDSSNTEDYSSSFCPPRKITDLLDIPGETHIRREGEYKVLFHCIKSSCDVSRCIYDDERTCRLMEEYEKWYSFEVWIDNKDNIIKIVEIDYLPIIYGDELINKVCGFYNGRFIPFEKRREFIFEDFLEFPEGVRVPLKTKVYTYRNSNIMSHITHDDNFIFLYPDLIVEYKRKKISAEEFRISTNCHGFDENIYFSFLLLEIDPDSLKVNKPIPEEIFIPPPVLIDHRVEINEYKEGKKQEQTNYIRPVLFITAFVSVTLLFLLITRKYFNWGI